MCKTDLIVQSEKIKKIGELYIDNIIPHDKYKSYSRTDNLYDYGRFRAMNIAILVFGAYRSI